MASFLEIPPLQLSVSASLHRTHPRKVSIPRQVSRFPDLTPPVVLSSQLCESACDKQTHQLNSRIFNLGGTHCFQKYGLADIHGFPKKLPANLLKSHAFLYPSLSTLEFPVTSVTTWKIFGISDMCGSRVKRQNPYVGLTAPAQIGSLKISHPLFLHFLSKKLKLTLIKTILVHHPEDTNILMTSRLGPESTTLSSGNNGGLEN